MFFPTAFDADAVKALRFIEISDKSLIVVASEVSSSLNPNEVECNAAPPNTFRHLSGPCAGNQSEGDFAYQGYSAVDQQFSMDDFILTGGTTDRSLSNSPHESTGATSAETVTSHSLQNAGSEVDSYGPETVLDCPSEVLNLESYVIANHFKSLLRWTVDDDSNQCLTSTDFPFVSDDTKTDGKYGFQLKHSSCLCTLSWAVEDSESELPKSGAEQDIKGRGAVCLLIDTRVKLYTITLSAPTMEEVRRRVVAFQRLIAVLEKMSHRMTLTGDDTLLSYCPPLSLFPLLPPVVYSCLVPCKFFQCRSPYSS